MSVPRDRISRAFRAAMCGGKFGFRSMGQALTVAKGRMRALKRRGKRIVLDGYRCPACGLYHIGNNS